MRYNDAVERPKAPFGWKTMGSHNEGEVEFYARNNTGMLRLTQSPTGASIQANVYTRIPPLFNFDLVRTLPSLGSKTELNVLRTVLKHCGLPRFLRLKKAVQKTKSSLESAKQG